MKINIKEFLNMKPGLEKIYEASNFEHLQVNLSGESNMLDLDFQYDLMTSMAQKAALDFTNQKELTIKSWFSLAGYKFDSDQDYCAFLKNKCELVTNGRSFHVVDIITKEEIISWVEREVTTAIIDNCISSKMEMIPTFKIK